MQTITRKYHGNDDGKNNNINMISEHMCGLIKRHKSISQASLIYCF